MNPEILNDPQFRNKIVALINKGKKIAAIKTVRKSTGFGLKESKDIVDEIAQKAGRVSYHNEQSEDINSNSSNFIERKKADRSFLIYALIFLAVLILSYFLSNS